MSLNETLGLSNFRDHSLFPMFLEDVLEPALKPTDDPTDYEVLEGFRYWLENNDFAY